MELFVIHTFSRLAAKLSEMITKFGGCNLKIQHERFLTSMASKMAKPNISKIASILWISSKYWWREVWIVGGDRTKTKCPQQWGVLSFSPASPPTVGSRSYRGAWSIDDKQSYYREVPRWGVSNGTRYNWKWKIKTQNYHIFFQYIKIKNFLVMECLLRWRVISNKICFRPFFWQKQPNLYSEILSGYLYPVY